jgi:hypothetical protein
VVTGTFSAMRRMEDKAARGTAWVNAQVRLLTPLELR